MLVFKHHCPTKGSRALWRSGYCSKAAAAKSLQSCPTLCDPRDSSPPGYPIPGILQVRTLEWVAISFSNAWKWKVKMKSLSHPMDCSLPSSSVQGIFQASVLEWGAIAFSSSKAGAGKIQDTPITFCDVRKSVQKEMKTCSIQESTQRSS